MKKIFYTFAILLILIILVLGYLGFVPGVSSIFGSNKPRDLGISARSSDEQSMAAKLDIKYTVLSSASSPQASLQLSGSKKLDTIFSDRELTGLMAQYEKAWKYYLISDAQVRFNADGTGEVSGILNVDRIYGYAAAAGLTAEEVKPWLDKVKIFTSNPPIYLKGKAETKNGVLTGELQTLEIGRLPVPASILPNNAVMVDFIQNRLTKLGIKIQNASIESGKVNFQGAIPTSVGLLAK